VNEEAAGTGLLCEQSAVRTLSLGDVDLTYAVDGAMGLIPQVFFPDLPAGYWADHPEALTRHRQVAMSVGGLLVERGGRRLLIDAGLGTRAEHTPLGTMNSGALPDILAALGCDPAAIDTVAFTHLHVDHTGWAFTRNPDGTYRKTFPAARYLVAETEWAPYGRGETLTSAAPAAVIDELAATATLIDDGEEIFPGVRAVVTPGHTPGHTSYIITSAAGRRLIALGDAFHIPAQLGHPEWPSMPDIDGTAVLAARRKLIHELEQPDTLGFACHFGDQVFGRLTRTPDGLNGWEHVPATVIVPPPRRLDVAGDLPSRLGHVRADEMADTVGHRGGERADDHLAQSHPERRTAVQRADRGARRTWRRARGRWRSPARRRRCRRGRAARRRPGRGPRPSRSACAAPAREAGLVRRSSLLPPSRCPVGLTGLQPAEVRLKSKRDAFEQQCRVRAVRLVHRRALNVPQLVQELPALGVDDADRVGQPGGRRRDELQVELGEVGPRPGHLREPLTDALLAQGGEHVDLAVSVRCAAGLIQRDESGLLEPAEGHIDLTGVQRLPERAKGVVQPSAELVALGGLLRQHRQHDFLLHQASRITVRA
jgi:glyoxylase-like metal-dependent hydrolase (beta-lactamase superfamily II)